MNSQPEKRLWPKKTIWALASLGFIWLLTILYPLSMTQPGAELWVVQQRKLKEYGFFERGGAMMYTLYSTGRVSHPERFNYVHHPLPIFWVYHACYRIFGGWGVIGVAAFLGLAGCLGTFLILRSFFDFWPSYLAALGYALAAPVTVASLDHNPGPFVWILCLLVVACGRIPVEVTKTRAWLLGFSVFMAGQLEWLAYTVIPSLLLITFQKRANWRESITASFRSLAWRWILGGWFATITVFVLQIVLYQVDFGSAIGHARGRMALSHASSWSFAHLITAAPLKVLILTGPGLLLGFIAGVWFMWRRKECSRLAQGALFYLIMFACAALVFSNYFFAESHMYMYLIFPLSAIAAYGLQHAKTKLLPVCFTVLLLPGALIGQFHSENLRFVPKTPRVLAKTVAENSRPEDLVLSNLEELKPPFAPWDHRSGSGVSFLSDRLVAFNITNVAAAEVYVTRLSPPIPHVVFIKALHSPMNPDLRKRLEDKGQLVAELEIPLPGERTTVARRLRVALWQAVKRYPIRQGASQDIPPSVLKLEVYDVHW